MKSGFLPLLALLVGLAAPALAETQERGVLGYGRLFNNDAIGDGHDRWRTGSYTVSAVRAYSWNGALPTTFGELLEYRLGAQIIAPASLTSPAPTDRRYAGVLSFGLHTHWSMGSAEASFGLDLVATGAQTGIGRFQKAVHKLLGLTEPTVLGNQIGNGIHPTLVGEIGRSFALGENLRLRPFVEATAGAETLVRVGGDLTIGSFGRRDLMLRDGTTGQRFRGIRADGGPGFSFTLGADIAHVASSIYLPSGGAATLSPTRSRVRAGINWQGERIGAFYGLTWLSREFEEQPAHQLVGSLRISLDF